MLVRAGSIAHQGHFMAMLEQHWNDGAQSIWRYVISDEDTGEEVYDGWAADLEEAAETAEKHLEYLSPAEHRPKQ